jgi:hypothetical protein
VEERILELLRRDFNLAKQNLAAASEQFDALIREAPSGLPHPDGAQRLKNASNALSEARKKLMDATVRLNKFILHGTAPSDKP